MTIKIRTTGSDDLQLGPWVYCAQHLRPHTTGWCGVDIGEKVGLGEFSGSHDEQARAAVRKCRHLGLKIWDPT